MPKTLSKESILNALMEEKLGFKFGKPDRPTENSLACLLPIIRETTRKRQYVTMPETDQVLVTDSGTISKLNVKNSSKENVFLRSGTIFEGKGTQSRVVTRSAVLFPGQEVALDARCVHASHGIRSGAAFNYGGTVPISVESNMYSTGFTPRNQASVWASVQASTSEMQSHEDRPIKMRFGLGEEENERPPLSSIGRNYRPPRTPPIPQRRMPTGRGPHPTSASIVRGQPLKPPSQSGPKNIKRSASRRDNRMSGSPQRGQIPPRTTPAGASSARIRDFRFDSSVYGSTSRVNIGANRDEPFGPLQPIRSISADDAPSFPSIPSPEESFGSYSAFATDNLKQNFDAFAQTFDAVLSKARLHDNQCGVALITEGGCRTVELFDVPMSWEALHKDAVKKMGTELLRGEDKTNVFEYKPEHAVAAVKKVLALDYKTNLIYEHKPSNGEPHVAIFGMSASRYVGEVVEVGGEVVHLVILECAEA